MQLSLLNGPPSATEEPPKLVSKRWQGCVFHGKQGSLRIRGRLSDGRWLAHRCTRAGKDLVPVQEVFLPAEWGWLTQAGSGG